MKKSRFSEAAEGFIDLIISGILWLICSLPLVTLGTATTALYYTVVKCVRRDRGHTVRTFFGAFRSNFKDSFVIWLIYLGYILLCAADRFLYGLMGSEGVVFGSGAGLFGNVAGVFGSGAGLFGNVALILLLPAALTFPWMFAYISRFSNTKRNCFLAAVSLTVKNPGRSVLLVLLLGGSVLITYLLPAVLPFIVGPCCLAASMVIEPVFKEMTKDMDTGDMDAWFNE